MKRWKRFLAAALAASMLTGCGIPQKDSSVYQVGMVTGTGGVNDQSFNQLSWEGLEALAEHTGAKVSYLESKQASDFLTNLDRLTDTYCDLIWGIGFQIADSVQTIAKTNADMNFAIIDVALDECPHNITGVVFRAEEPSFLVGYVAGMSTKTGKVGYVGPMKSFNNDKFQYGYLAGVEYAAYTLGKDIEIQQQFAESYSDAAKAKAIANKMYSNGCDIIFHSAGGAGYGVIESAKENGQFVIGVDTDQSYLAPDNVLTSALKNVDIAIELVSAMAMEGEKIGGQNFSYGLEEECVGIPEENPNMEDSVYEETMKVKDLIISGEIVPPATEDEYNAFLEGLYN